MTIGLEVVKLFYKYVHSSILEKKYKGLALKGESIAYPTHSYKPTLAKRLAITSGYIEPMVEIEWDTRIIYTNQLYIYT